MALSAATLKTVLETELESKVRIALELGDTAYPKLTSYCQAIADAISSKVIEHILDNAEVTGTVEGETIEEAVVIGTIL